MSTGRDEPLTKAGESADAGQARQDPSLAKPAARLCDVDTGEAGMRLDRWFKLHFPNLRHGALEKMLRKGEIRVDGGRVKANRRLEAGEQVRIPPSLAGDDGAAAAPRVDDYKQRREDAEFIRSLIVYEDEALLAINKPFGLAVQGGAKTKRHIDGMLAALEKDGERPRLVHRLDRDTGGLLLLGKTRAATAKLAGAFQRHEIEKVYWALVAGAPHPRQGTIDLKIGPVEAAGRERMGPSSGPEAKKAITDYQLIDDAGGGVGFVAMRPVTGRKHQLRVHCAAIEAPIVGDRKYGGEAAMLEGVAANMHLFCRSMTFPHPVTGRPLSLTAPLTGHMRDTWDLFAFDSEADVDWPELR